MHRGKRTGSSTFLPVEGGAKNTGASWTAGRWLLAVAVCVVAGALASPLGGSRLLAAAVNGLPAALIVLIARKRDIGPIIRTLLWCLSGMAIAIFFCPAGQGRHAAGIEHIYGIFGAAMGFVARLLVQFNGPLLPTDDQLLADQLPYTEDMNRPSRALKGTTLELEQPGIDALTRSAVATRRTILGPLLRAGRTLVVMTPVVASLLAFPSVLPWMIAFWLAWHTARIARGEPGWAPLVACVAILLAKRVYWPSTLIAFAVVALVVAAWRGTQCRASQPQRHISWATSLLLWAAWGAVLLQWHAAATCSRPLALDLSRSIVCLGDSLTSGVLPDRGYPEQLQHILCLPVINLGQSGITTEGGFERLSRIPTGGPPPQIVVLELGGHDYLKGLPRAATKQNLVHLIDACQAMGADVALMEIPRAFMSDPFWGLEREIAHEKDLELISDSGIRQLVLWSPISPPGMWFPRAQLSDDGIHSNPRGSAFLARHVAKSLERMYGGRIASDAHRAPMVPGRWTTGSSDPHFLHALCLPLFATTELCASPFLRQHRVGPRAPATRPPECHRGSPPQR